MLLQGLEPQIKSNDTCCWLMCSRPRLNCPPRPYKIDAILDELSLISSITDIFLINTYALSIAAPSNYL